MGEITKDMYCSHGTQTTVVHVNNWEDARWIGNSLRRWLFRGQKKAKWLLKSSLERAFEDRKLSINCSYSIEEMILMDFKSAAHLFSSGLPNNEDTIAWLSLIRHHGGPTRLLDFTESFYVASYFALEDATEDCAIWAFNRIDFMKRVNDIINNLSFQLNIDTNISIGRKLDEILVRTIRGDVSKQLVITMSSSQRNERQFLQKGLAMIPLSLQYGFMGALLGSFDPPGVMADESNKLEVDRDQLCPILEKSKLVKIIISKDCFLEAKLDLGQMNINGATLFRGLDGLGRQLYDVFNVFERYKKDRDDNFQ